MRSFALRVIKSSATFRGVYFCKHIHSWAGNVTAWAALKPHNDQTQRQNVWIFFNARHIVHMYKTAILLFRSLCSFVRLPVTPKAWRRPRVSIGLSKGFVGIFVTLKGDLGWGGIVDRGGTGCSLNIVFFRRF